MSYILDTITAHRIARDWSEYQLAIHSDLPQTTISSWYKKGMTPSVASLEKICAGLGITLSQFFAYGQEAVVLTPEQRQMLDGWNMLDPEKQQFLLQLIDQMR